MAIEKHKLQNESPIQRKIRLLLYPVIFSLFLTLNGYAQTKESKTNTNPKSIKQTEVVMDSTFTAIIENVLNQLTSDTLTDLEREKLNKDIINSLSFYFNESDDPLKAIKLDQMYVKRKGGTIPQKLEWFLENFYNESYRSSSSGSLSVKVLSIYQKDKKIYIEYDYVYTPKKNVLPKDTPLNNTIPKDTVPNNTMPKDTVPNNTMPKDTVPKQ